MEEIIRRLHELEDELIIVQSELTNLVNTIDNLQQIVDTLLDWTEGEVN